MRYLSSRGDGGDDNNRTVIVAWALYLGDHLGQPYLHTLSKSAGELVGM